MFNKFHFLKFSLSLCNLILLASGSCIIVFSDDIQLRPKYQIQIGNKPIFSIAYQEKVTLDDEETIDVFCDAGFHFPFELEGNRELKESSLTLRCLHQEIYYHRNWNDYNVRPQGLECARYIWSLFQLTTSLPFCSGNHINSFLLSTSNILFGENIVFGTICFDYDKMSVDSMYYVKGKSNETRNIYNTPINKPTYMDLDLSTIPGTNITHFERFFKMDRIDPKKLQYQDDGNPNYWQNYNNFLTASLMQDKQYADIFNKYELLLKINWWPSLLRGNWKRFMHALETHTATTDNVYHIFTGTSGNAQIPFKHQKCQHETTTNLSEFAMNKTVPEYIWTYLEELRGIEKFVVVAFNSPFFEFFEKENLIFCKDMCDSIEWLKDARTTFRYAVFGVVFCCSVEEVREKNILKGFPTKQLIATTTTGATIQNSGYSADLLLI